MRESDGMFSFKGSLIVAVALLLPSCADGGSSSQREPVESDAGPDAAAGQPVDAGSGGMTASAASEEASMPGSGEDMAPAGAGGSGADRPGIGGDAIDPPPGGEPEPGAQEPRDVDEAMGGGSGGRSGGGAGGAATTGGLGGETAAGGRGGSVGAGVGCAAAGAGGTAAGGMAAGGGSGGEPPGDAGSGGTSGDELSGTPTHEARPDLPSVRQEHGAAALDGEVYVLGGFTPSVSSSVQVFTPETEMWRDAADFPALFHHPNVAVVDGLLYVAGFHVGSTLNDADERVFAYDPSVDEWTPREPMPLGTERGSACTATLGRTIYLFGGASYTTLPDASAYDTVADEWMQLAPMPELREHCYAAGIGGKIYIVSGRSGGIVGPEPESWVYDPATAGYEERASIPTPRGGGAGAVLGGHIFLFGGEGNTEDPDGIFREVEAYDPVTDSWDVFPDMLIPRHGFAAATLGGTVYLPGGATKQGFDATATHTGFRFEQP